jgi:hypothetical protein
LLNRCLESLFGYSLTAGFGALMLSANRNFRASARIRKKTVPEENYVFGVAEKNSKGSSSAAVCKRTWSPEENYV